MSIYLSHRSAFEYWRANDPLPNLGPARARPLPGERPSKSEVDALDVRRFGVSAAPVHVAVAGANDRSQAKGLTCHVLSEPVRPGAFPRVEEGLYVASPEQAFMDMSVELPLVELVRFGYLLCGTYVFDSGGGGFRRRLHGSPTTVEALRERAEGARGERGVNRATRALRYVANGSASPMETNLAMALCLPRMLGGYGFELPQLNARIEARAQGS